MGSGASKDTPAPAPAPTVGVAATGNSAAAAAPAAQPSKGSRGSTTTTAAAVATTATNSTAGPAVNLQTPAAQDRVRKARNLAGHSESDEFHNACMAVFQKADLNKDGMLDRNEFWNVLHSKSLNLKLSADEKEEFMKVANVDKDGAISYAEFVPIVKRLLQRMYSKKTNDWNDWCWFKGANSQVYYMNKRTGHVQLERPPNFTEHRVEEMDFSSLVLADGTEVTTMVDETGAQKYLDFDTQEWKPLPAEWLEQPGKQTDDNLIDDADPRVGSYRHPTRGVFTTYLFDNSRNTRLYFDDHLGQWARMPLAWERNVDDVKLMLEELDRAFPEWKSVNEQLLVLRECNYDLADALVFAEINWSFRKKKKQQQGLARRTSRIGFAVPSDRLPEAEMSGLSVTVSSHIYDIETKLAAAKKEIDELRLQLKDHTQEQVQTLTREKTKVETSLARKDRDAHDANVRIAELSKQLSDQRDVMATMEREVVAYKADRDKMLALEKQLAAQSHGETDQALKLKTAEAEQLRLENVALKMKLQHVMQKLEYPMANPETVALIKSLVQRLRQLKQEKDLLIEETRTDLEGMTKLVSQASKAGRGLAESVLEQVADITQKYRAEMLQRKLLYNKVQELRGNIRVFCRVRNDTRVTADDTIFSYPSQTELVVANLQGEQQLVDFDRVYGPGSSQEAVFEDTKPVMLSCVDGYNVCIMAYGQTGSGKTFTMMGPAENIGVNRRAIRELLDLCNKATDVKYNIKVSLVEVYNEKIFDLLTGDRSVSLDVRQDSSGTTYVEGLVEEEVRNASDVESVLARGDKHRSIASTAMNTNSSRSHLVMQLTVTGYNAISKATTSGKLTLVDLAGSERVSKSEASGPRLVEAAAINKSLSALGHVFKALASNSPHIPYRNSKLTFLLQDSLGGDSKTCVFLNCSPLRDNLSESLCTLAFGRNIRKIELGPATKHHKALPRK